MSIYNNSRVAVTSQENAAVWVGDLQLLDGSRLSPGHPQWVNGSATSGAGGSTDGERALFGLSGGTVYVFPRNSQCERIYCNVEVRGAGRAWGEGGTNGGMAWSLAPPPQVGGCTQEWDPVASSMPPVRPQLLGVLCCLPQVFRRSPHR